jgi:hypothetical protein
MILGSLNQRAEKQVRKEPSVDSFEMLRGTGKMMSETGE